MNLKTTIYWKNCWSGSIKIVRILIFTQCYIFLKKLRKTPGNIIILNMCTKKLDDIYRSWDIEHDGLKLVIFGHFLPFYPPKNQKNQNLDKLKKLPEISSFYTCVPKIMIMMYTPFRLLFCHFGPFFALLPHNQPRKLKFWKNEKNAWRYYPFTHVYHKWRSYDIWFLRNKVQHIIFRHFGLLFALLPHWQPRKSKYCKN